jgi:predicted AAA+ superfamily ATPase
MDVQRTSWHRRIERSWERRSIVWLVGVRRVGKTVLCRTLPDVDYYDCEDPDTRAIMQDPIGFLDGVKGRRVVLDEVHRLTAPSQLLKLAADYYPETRIIATGSSTLAATRKFKDALTGRKFEIHLTPMTLADLEAFGGTLDDRLWWGGLPPFFLGGAETRGAEFQEWMDSYWARDISELFGVRQRASFVRFVELMVANSGGLFEASWYAARCEASRPTIASYLDILDITRVGTIVRPFSTRRATEIVATPKVYAFDTGFARFYKGLGERRPEDMGSLWEHFVLSELRATEDLWPVHHWRDKQHREVDFVIARHGRPPIAIECRWTWQNIGDLRGLRAFRKSYPEGENFVACGNVERSWTARSGDAGYEVVGLRQLIERLEGVTPAS